MWRSYLEKQQPYSSNPTDTGTNLLGRIFFLLFVSASIAAQSPVTIAANGTPTYLFSVGMPPGIAGMTPNISLLYSANSVNGPVGYGWSIQGISMITRCPASKLIDGIASAVGYSIEDKLCLDGQRLIQTESDGVVINAAVLNPGASNQFQRSDAQGGTEFVKEYRTENDMYARIRSYGSAHGDSSFGPAWFKVWTKAGQIYEYGVNSNPTSQALINALGSGLVVAWPVSRISDTLGNYIDFQYQQRELAWGSAPAGSNVAAHEWSLSEIRYTGNAAQLPNNKVVFSYGERADNPNGQQDISEAYHQGKKSINRWLLDTIRTYVNWPADRPEQPAEAIEVKAIKLTYDKGPVTNRSLLAKISECDGTDESKCLPATTFQYTPGSSSYTRNAQFDTGSLLARLPLLDINGVPKILTGNFLGNGRTDILVRSYSLSGAELFQSNGDGSFALVPNFNITDQVLFSNDGCIVSYAADVNGDGLTDILRATPSYAPSGASCPDYHQNILYLANGDGSFNPIDINASGIDFTQILSTKHQSSSRHYCYENRMKFCYDTVTTGGKNFYLLDINNDGVLDVITTELFGSQRELDKDLDLFCSTECTKVYFGKKEGGFEKDANTNLKYTTVYAEPPRSPGVSNVSYVMDINGDGFSDLQVSTGAFLSRGDGNFDHVNVSSNLGCASIGDFNGDGKKDCIHVNAQAANQFLVISDGTTKLKNTENFNLTSAGNELLAVNADKKMTMGIQLADLNGDGRSDIIRWGDDPGSDAIYLSNGDGTFRNEPGTGLLTSNEQLKNSDGTADFITGDFTGRGTVEVLRMGSGNAAIARGDTVLNRLYVKTESVPPDQLLSVVSGTGLATRLTWVPLSNSAIGTLGERYHTDRGTANAATYPVVDMVVPSYVVATVKSDSGVGGQTVDSEYSYQGLKYAHDGRGWLGFRETSSQHPGPDSSPITVRTQFLYTEPYSGLVDLTQTWIGDLNSATAPMVSSASYIYCDATSATVPASATPSTPCITSARVRRPYLFQSTESGNDLNGAALPTVTTTNTFNSSGDPSKIVVSTSGTAFGLTQTFTKTSTNDYFPDNISGDQWILGRLQNAAVTNSVPNSLDGITTSAGSNDDAGLTRGGGLLITLSPSLLTIHASQPGIASGTVYVSAEGGSTPYQISWTRTAGTLSSVSSNTDSNPTFSAEVTVGDSFTETWTVIITDAEGNTGQASIAVNFVGPDG